MKIVTTLIALLTLSTLMGCVAVPVGRHYGPRAVVVAPVVVHPYYDHGYRRW